MRNLIFILVSLALLFYISMRFLGGNPLTVPKGIHMARPKPTESDGDVNYRNMSWVRFLMPEVQKTSPEAVNIYADVERLAENRKNKAYPLGGFYKGFGYWRVPEERNPTVRRGDGGEIPAEGAVQGHGLRKAETRFAEPNGRRDFILPRLDCSGESRERRWPRLETCWIPWPSRRTPKRYNLR